MIKHSDIVRAAFQFEKLLNRGILNSDNSELIEIIEKEHHLNKWFTSQNVLQRLSSILKYLQTKQFETFYNSFEQSGSKTTFGIVCNEKIPLEAFPTLLAVLLSGNCFIYKISENSDKTLPYFFKKMAENIPEWRERMIFQDAPLKNIHNFIFYQNFVSNEALISYTRKNKTYIIPYRKTVAILTGDESENELKNLATDIFSYFGKGSGNVSKIYVPEQYSFEYFYPFIEDWNAILNHNAYANNFQYQQSVYLLNKVKNFDNGFLLLKEDTSMIAPTGVLFFERYTDFNLIKGLLVNDNFQVYYNHYKDCQPFGSSAFQELQVHKDLLNFIQS